MNDFIKISQHTFIIIIIYIISGCNNSIDPLNENKGVYSIYGALNIAKGINYIRVKNLNKPLPEDSLNNLNAKVTLTNLNSGNTTFLEDIVVEYEGVKTHNFRTNKNLQPATKYRISVQRSDGQNISATTTTPRFLNIITDTLTITCDTQVNMIMAPIDDKSKLFMEIGIQLGEEFQWMSANRLPVVSDGSAFATFTPAGFLYGYFGECKKLELTSLYVRYTRYGPNYQASNNVSDSLGIPGGAGTFIGIQKDTVVYEMVNEGTN